MSVTPAVLETVSRLVAFDSTSRKSNLEIIDYLKDCLTGLGAECRLTHNDDGKKANLYATLGPTDRPGIMLSGHTDVVPTEGQAWSSDPYKLIERNGALYGRGSADMKSFIALAVALAPDFLARGLDTPLHFAFSYDEEVGCIGVRRLIEDLNGLPIKPRLCIVGEPTGMKVVAGHKGKRNFSCTVHGKECHSALVAEGVNAIEAAAEMIAHIKGMQRDIKKNGPFDPAYEPPYTTLHTGVIEGGRALNIVPNQCKFEFEIRALALDSADDLTDRITAYAREALEPEMKAVHSAAGFDFTIMNDTDGFDLPDDHEAVRLVTELTGDNRTGRVSFGTEAGLFNNAGIPTVVCGPGYIDQAHKPDEFISLDQLAQGEAFIRRLMSRICVD
jgi:acetylornithine deacetylase